MRFSGRAIYQGDNLAELWVNFLMSEAEADAKKPTVADQGSNSNHSSSKAVNNINGGRAGNNASVEVKPLPIGLASPTSPSTPASSRTLDNWQFNFSTNVSNPNASTPSRNVTISANNDNEVSKLGVQVPRSGSDPMSFNLVPESPKFSSTVHSR